MTKDINGIKLMQNKQQWKELVVHRQYEKMNKLSMLRHHHLGVDCSHGQ